MLVFEERGKPKYPEKKPRAWSKEENQQQTQPTYMYDTKSRKPGGRQVLSPLRMPSLLKAAPGVDVLGLQYMYHICCIRIDFNSRK